ncbi:MAG: hypothetical protein M3N31_08815 [Actinomycetota bacterium]|nr:hypothetical protein [Actinomycetota bacterium]
MVTPEERPVSALPSAAARALAFVAILVAGGCGGLIGASLVNLQCRGDCSTPSGIAALVGALVAAGGVAVVAVLVLRAMGEWRSTGSARQRELHRVPEDDGGAGAVSP